MPIDYIYPGVLGSKDSRLGAFQLAAVPLPALTLTESITVDQTIDLEILHHLYQPLTVSVTVDQTIAFNISRAIHYTDTITVDQTATPVLLPPILIDQFVSEIIYVSPSDARVIQFVAEIVYTKSKAFTITDTITVTPTIRSGGSTNLSVATNITVTQTQRGDGRSVPITVTDHITVNSTPQGRNTNVRLAVVDTITTQQVDGAHDNKSHKTVSDTITITSQVYFGGFIYQSVTDTIYLPDYFQIAKAFPNPNRQSNIHYVTVTPTIIASTSIHSLTILDTIIVNSIVRNNQILQSYTDVIIVSDTLVGGSSSRPQTVASTIQVITSSSHRSNKIRQSKTDNIIVTSNALAHPPLLPIDVNDTISVTPIVNIKIPNHQIIIDQLTVVPNIDSRNSITRITVNELISISEKEHISPINIPVTTIITVNQTQRMTSFTVTSRITVTQKINKSNFIRLLDTLEFDQILIDTRILHHSVIDRINVTSQPSVHLDVSRTLTDNLIFYDDREYIKHSSIGDIVVPIIIGFIMPNNMTLTTRHSTITLPPPQWNDQEGNVQSVSVKRSMTGLTYTHIKTTDRRKLAYIIRLTKLKYFELRSWVIKNYVEEITISDWKGGVWIGYLTTDLNDFVNIPNFVSDWYTIDLEFQAVKIG